MKSISICDYISGEEKQLFNLVKAGFDEFVSSDCDEEGRNFFYRFIEPDNFIKRNESETFILTAKSKNGIIVGMIEVKYNGHICLLFVDREFQGMGISKSLLLKSKAICKSKTGSDVTMSVNSSIYAAEIYKKLGFKVVGKPKKMNGISFIEMEFISD